MKKIQDLLGWLTRFLHNEEHPVHDRMTVITELTVMAAAMFAVLGMVLLGQTIVSMLPNFALIGTSLGALYLFRKKHFRLSATVMIVAGAGLILPWMYFASGACQGGMMLWLVAGVVVVCLIATEKHQVLLVSIIIVEYALVVLMAHYRPDLVVPFANDSVAFFDKLQSFLFICVGISLICALNVRSYEHQRKLLEQQQKGLLQVMSTDTLTQISNRRAYYDDSHDYYHGKFEEDLVLVAMDVNSLKRVNDSQGHAQGDALLETAADTIYHAFCKYGKVYRIGGDEFIALLHCTKSEAELLPRRLEAAIELSDAPIASELTISSGVVRWAEHSSASFHQLEKLADQQMYLNKQRYHESEKAGAHI